MFTLFDLDEHYRITIHDVPDEEYPDETHKAVQFNYFLLDEFFEEWALRKKELTEGIISKSEYMEWKLNWPSTAGEDPRVKWQPLVSHRYLAVIDFNFLLSNCYQEKKENSRNPLCCRVSGVNCLRFYYSHSTPVFKTVTFSQG